MSAATAAEVRRPWQYGGTRLFRLTRGEGGGYQCHYYRTQEDRDAAARRFAAQDSSSVLTFLWSEDHPQDDLNQGWACDGTVGDEYDPRVDEPQGKRGVAASIRPGDTVTVFAHPVDRIDGEFRTGVVRAVLRLPAGMLRIALADDADAATSTAWDAVDTAVTYWPEAAQ